MTDHVRTQSVTSPIHGPVGRADRIPFDTTAPRSAETVTWWLLDAPGFSPAWEKYIVVAVRLRDDVPGFPAPRRSIPDATHEIVIAVLHPDHPATVEAMARPDYQLRMLEPINFAHQLVATDAEVELLVALMCRSICDGRMPPEPILGYEGFRLSWAETIAGTLAHHRGGVHGS